LVLAREEADLNAVDEPMPAFPLDHGLGLVRLVVAEVIRRQGFFDGVHADADFLVVVRSTVFAQEILEHIGRYVLAALDLVQKVLPHHLPGEYARCFLVQVVLLHSGLLNRASRSLTSASPIRPASAGRSPSFRSPPRRTPGRATQGRAFLCPPAGSPHGSSRPAPRSRRPRLLPSLSFPCRRRPRSSPGRPCRTCRSGGGISDR